MPKMHFVYPHSKPYTTDRNQSILAKLFFNSTAFQNTYTSNLFSIIVILKIRRCQLLFSNSRISLQIVICIASLCTVKLFSNQRQTSVLYAELREYSYAQLLFLYVLHIAENFELFCYLHIQNDKQVLGQEIVLN